MIALSKLPLHLAEALRAERRDQRAAAQAFADACAAGDLDEFARAVMRLNDLNGDWRLAFKLASQVPTVPQDVRGIFFAIWLESRELPRRVGDPRVLVAGLRSLLPLAGAGAPMRIYRGARAGEVRRRKGISWTTRIEMAREFAEQYRDEPRGGVVFETVAHPEAILIVVNDPDFDEGEVIVDPFLLGAVTVVERHRNAEAWRPPEGDVVFTAKGTAVLRTVPPK